MSSAVHISIDRKLDVSALVHIENLYGMLVVQCPAIRARFVVEAENDRELIRADIIAEQTVCHLKDDNVSILALEHGHLRVCDAEQYLVVAVHTLRIRYLGHCPLIVQQVHSVRRIPDAVIFLRQIIGHLLSV